MARQSVTKYTKSGMTVYGTLTVTGAISAGSGLSYTNLTLSGNLVVQGDTHLGNAVGDAVHVIGTAEFDENATFDKNIVVGTGATVTAGGLTVSAGNIVATLGDVAANTGNITAAAGNITATVGNVTAGATVQGADLIATDDLTVGDDAGITGDLTVNGNTVLGNAIGDTTTISGSASVGGNLGVTGTLTAGALVVSGTFTADDFTVTDDLQVGDDALISGDLTVTGATVLNGNVDLGNAGADTISLTGSVDTDITFLTGAGRSILGPASNDLTIQALAGRSLVLQSNGANTQITCLAAGGVQVHTAVQFDSTVMVDGIMTFSANPVFDIAGACSITGTAGQNMTIAAAGAGHAILTASHSSLTLEDGAGGNGTLTVGAGTLTLTAATVACGTALTCGTDFSFVGAAGHAINGVNDQALTIGSLGTGVLTLESATGNLVLQSDGAAAAITISGGADLITLGSPLTTTETIAKTGTANGGAVTIKVAEGLHNVAGGGLTETIAAAIPAGALVLTALFRVTTVIASAGGASWDAGVGGATTRYAENLAFAAGTTSTMADHVAASSPIFYKVATDIVLTLDAGTWTSGAIRWKVFYIDSTAIAS